MTTATAPLPIRETIEPSDQDSAASAVREAYETATPIYPIGGGTSLDFGLPAQRDGIGLRLSRLNNVIDYPSGDMTITVEAGIVMQRLATILAAASQWLPVDVPNSARATLGGVIATNWNGPRRYGLGNLRDHVIGIRAIDGTGRCFNGGGRVVKNVAGYDFCKLLTGSLGTLGVITQVTVKLKPIPESMTLVICGVSDLAAAESLLGELAQSAVTPTAIELVSGPAWQDEPVFDMDKRSTGLRIIVALEGTGSEVRWMERQIESQWRVRRVERLTLLRDAEANRLWNRLIEFSALESPLTIKATIVPSGTTPFIAAAREIDPACSIQAHAGSGVVFVRFAEFPRAGLTKTLVGKLQPLANSLNGNVVVLSNPSGAEMTHQCVWGGIDSPFQLMCRVRDQFDPKNILNPGRFVYT